MQRILEIAFRAGNIVAKKLRARWFRLLLFQTKQRKIARKLLKTIHRHFNAAT